MQNQNSVANDARSSKEGNSARDVMREARDRVSSRSKAAPSKEALAPLAQSQRVLGRPDDASEGASAAPKLGATSSRGLSATKRSGKQACRPWQPALRVVDG